MRPLCRGHGCGIIGDVADGGGRTGLEDREHEYTSSFCTGAWSGSPLAIQPIAVAAQLGLTRAGELWWLVKQAIYGLRESPAVWSEFRDKELREARWKTNRSGEQVECRLQQLVANNQIWRITTVENEDVTLGYLTVYVDDVLAMGEEPVLNDFYSWIAEKWECDDWTRLSPTTPIRFLGMELFESEDGYELGSCGVMTIKGVARFLQEPEMSS